MSAAETRPTVRLSIFRNWLTLIGFVGVVGSLFSFLLLVALDVLSPTSNPYVGILGYLVAPFFVGFGLLLVVVGLFIEHRRIVKDSAHPPPLLLMDFSQPHARRNLVVFAMGTAAFLLFAAIASYRSYHFSESSGFCGQACHAVMNPEFTTYLHSPHARISCSACHIGPGAAWYVKAKISGLYQVYATLSGKFSRPIATPVKNLRPAQETCEQCHWPQKFAGNLERIYSHFLTDDANTPYEIRMLLKVGGGDPTHGPLGGIHWHMNVGQRVEYIATDEQRQVIPWVRVTDLQGVVTEYRTPKFDGKVDPAAIRRMDCMDCHNRPSHVFQNPNDTVDLALALGNLDPKMPGIKKMAMDLLSQTYATEKEAMQKIATALHAKYAEDPRYSKAIDVIQKIYRDNFFPEMKTDWRVHPNNLGHKDWPGCFRCHDGEHVTADGKKPIKANDCTACHIILAQGSGKDLERFNPAGNEFAHPGGDIGDAKCVECHPVAGK